MARRISFLIGNEKFASGSGLEDLFGPCNDVLALRTVLEDPARGAFEVVNFLNEPRNVVLPALDMTLNQASVTDTLLIFYAGHGKLDNGGRLCLAMADTQTGALYSTSIPAAELQSLIGQSNCGQIVLLLDCCFSGAFGREFRRGSVADQLILMSEAQGLHVLTASTSYETARELHSEADGLVMGKFTRALVDGIATGLADCDRDGLVTLSDLRRHLAKTVRGQTPQYWAQDAAGDPVIARAVPLESPVQKRLQRLGAWYANDQVPDELFVSISNAVAEQSGARLTVLAQRLLDNPSVTAEALIGAWQGAVRQEAQQQDRRAPDATAQCVAAEEQPRAEKQSVPQAGKHRSYRLVWLAAASVVLLAVIAMGAMFNRPLPVSVMPPTVELPVPPSELPPAPLPPTKAPPPPVPPPCGLLPTPKPQYAPHLAGFAAPVTDHDRKADTYDVAHLDPIFCHVVDALAPLVYLGPSSAVQLQIDARPRFGTKVTPLVEAPDGATITIDLFNSKGEVFHLLRPSVRRRIEWTVAQPVGKWMAVLLASQPLALSTRPDTEDDSEYLRDLVPALQKNLADKAPNWLAGRTALVDAVLVEVVAQTKPASKCDLEKIKSITERVQMGGSLSNDEKAFLQSCAH